MALLYVLSFNSIDPILFHLKGHLVMLMIFCSSLSFSRSPVSYEADKLQFRWKPVNDTPIIKALSFRHLNAYLSKNATGECQWTHSWRTEFSCLSVYLIFTRDKLFYFSTVFVPGMVLVTSSFISFWLDVNAVPARVMIGVTTMLNFCTTTNR